MNLAPKQYALDVRKVTTGLGVEYQSMIATQYGMRDLKRAARTNGYSEITIVEKKAQRVHVTTHAL